MKTMETQKQAEQNGNKAVIVKAAFAGLDFKTLEIGTPELTKLEKLRFQVYCQEERFLNAANYPDGIESDLFDAFSVHIAAYDGPAQIVGGLRLILNNPLGFPMKEHAGKGLWPIFHQLPAGKTAEISRLVIPRTKRCAGQEAVAMRQATPILCGLFKNMYQASVRQGIEYWLAAMEPRLQRMLGRFGFRFEQIGDPMEFYGTVIPYVARIADIERIVAASRPEVFREYQQGL